MKPARRQPVPVDGLYGAIRTTLITFGVAAFTFMLSRHESGAVPQALGAGGSAVGYVLGGVAVQILLLIAHAIIKRQGPDSAAATHGRLIIELIGDGITVLLFAIGVFGAALHAASAV